MTKIALFKWWKTKPENDGDDGYKILECEDGERFPIHHSEIHLAEELKRGQFITFEIEGNEAKNLHLLREVGVIGLYNKEKGFGSAILLINDSELLQLFERGENGTAEVFFYINEVTSVSQDLKRGDVVVCDIRKTYRRDKDTYRDNALNIKLLSTETDGEIIDNCVNSDNIDVLLAVFGCSLNDCQYDRAVNSLAHILSTCSVPNRISLISKLPEKIKEHDNIITFLSDEKKLEVWIKQLNNPEKYESAIKQIAEFLQGCADTKRSSFLSIIPGTAKQHPNIFGLLSNDEKLEFWVKELNNPEKYEIVIEQIAELLQGCSDNKRASVVGKIPLKAKQHPNIFNFLSDSEKLDFLISKLNNSESYQDAINGIATILESYPQKKSSLNTDGLLAILLEELNGNQPQNKHKSYDDLIKIINRIPDFAKSDEKIFKYLPDGEKIKILSGSLVKTLSKIEKVISQSSLSSSERKSLISKLPEWLKEIPLLQKYQVKISPVASRADAAEAEQIRAFVAEHEIKILCHFTTIENLQRICEDGGLLSVQKLRYLNNKYDQIDEGRWDGKLNHICCSIQSYNSMYLYHARSKSQCWVLLAIKPDYLWKQGTLFCPINAASEQGAYIKQGFAGLQSMYKSVVIDIKGREYTRQGLPSNTPTCVQAEVQVHESISLDDVICIGVAPGNEQKVRDAGWKGTIGKWSF
jgi:cold shock CspA family protein